MMELEGAEVLQAEEVEPTLKEGAKPTPPEGEPTVEKTYTEKEFRHEVDKAVGKGLESTNRQLSLRKKEVETAKAELEEYKSTTSAQIDDLRAEHEDRIREHEEALRAVDDETIKKSYTDRISLAKREREAARKEKTASDKLFKAETLVHQTGLEAEAKILSEETGIPIKDLEDCNTKDEMQVKALRYQLKQPAKEKPQETEEPKFDSGTSSGSGGMPEHPTIEQMEKWTPDQFAKWAESRYK